jgi:hypothetical protein
MSVRPGRSAPLVTTDAGIMVMIAESWLRSLLRAGDPSLEPRVVATLGRLALAAPATATRCPLLLRQLGPSVAHQVHVQASAPPVSEVAHAEAERARWLTTAEAAAALAITPHGVRDLLRRGQLGGRRSPAGRWLVDVADVRRYARERRDRAQTAA